MSDADREGAARWGEAVPTAVHQAAEAQLAVFSYPMDHKHQVVDPRLLACIMYITHVSCINKLLQPCTCRRMTELQRLWDRLQWSMLGPCSTWSISAKPRSTERG